MDKSQWSDDARRMADAVTLAAVAGSANHWMAFHLSDGRPADRVPYDTRYDAVSHMRWDRDNFVYVLVPPDGMQPKEADACLTYARALHDAGFRLPDPEFIDVMPTMPALKSDQRKQINYLTKK
jgi:hypothetical protein